jgi:hypothetical protein
MQQMTRGLHTRRKYMKQIHLLLLLTLIATALSATQDQQAAAPAGNAQTAQAIVNPNPQSSGVRILTPVAGQTLESNFVEVRFELVRPSASGEPNFLVQLDGADPVNMTSTDYTFSELQPGLHSVRVTLVDANKSPVEGASATVQFKVSAIQQPAHQPAHTDGSRGAIASSNRTVAGAAPSAPIPPELRNDRDVNLPMAGSPLPLLSLIGFGLLIGGAAQTMRSR